jgi:uncharacterized membrane protein
MNFKIAMFIVVIFLGITAACGDKKGKEDHGHSHAADDATEIIKETSKTNAVQEEAKKIKEDSLRKVDSLRQVKEHGHAH